MSDLLVCLVYAEDLLVMGNNSARIHSLIATLNYPFIVKDLGKLFYFLGIEAHWYSTGLHLFHHKYVQDPLKRVHMDAFSLVSTLASPFSKLSLSNSHQFHDQTLYMSVVGALYYLTFNRPNIAYVLNKLSQFMYSPRDSH